MELSKCCGVALEYQQSLTSIDAGWRRASDPLRAFRANWDGDARSFETWSLN